MSSKLKSFELQGYKTFASRTEFEFADRLTAIIGPNGSGKSNIADALRWVLGEQSYSLLRGKKTEDMIFSGSESRSRSGMASATILFDNSSNWLPIDFSEVAITRRAYRDGQNEYLLNGQRVRLKDVSELLAQSGLAERTYTVIGQGLIDTALSLRAEERRKLFEEAAGIGLYRSRREEALRRLDSTHRNIERVQDIVAELQPRLRSLERQAKRTNEYERVKADLRVYLLDWYGYHWHQTQRELAKAKVEVRKQESDLNKARIDQQKIDEKIIGFRDRIQSLRTELAIKHNDLSKYHTRKEYITREIAVANERIRSLRDARYTAQSEHTRLKEEISLYENRVENTEGELLHLNSEFEDAQSQFEQCKQVLEEYQNQLAVVNQQITQSKIKLTNVLTQKANFDAHESRLMEQITQQRKAIENANLTIKMLDGESSELESQKKSLLQTLSELISLKKEKHDALIDIQQRIKYNQSEKDRLNKLLHSYSTELSRVKTQLAVLEQAENTFQGYAEGTRILIEAMREQRISGGEGALNSFLEIPAQIETAIASVLGEYVDAFLLNNNNGVDSALEALAQQSVRGILLPVDSLEVPSTLSVNLEKTLSDRDEILGVASKLVGTADKYQKVVDLLLGQVLIVKDRAAAKRVIDDRSLRYSSNMRVVTLKGEVFYSSGPVITGSSGQTILSRPRFRKELDLELRDLSEKFNELEAKSAELDDNYAQFQHIEQSLDKEAQEYLGSENQLVQELNQVEVDIEKIVRNLKWNIEQREQIAEEISQREVDIQNIQSRLVNIEEEVREMSQIIQVQEKSLHEIPIADQQAQYTYWSSRVAVLERGMSDQKARLSDLLESKQRALDAVGMIESRINRFNAELDEQEILIRKLNEEEKSIQKNITDLQNENNPLEAEVKSLEHDLLNLQKNDVESRQTLSTAENHHAQARIKYSQSQDKIERLRQRIEDDFGLVEYQYTEEISGPTPLPLEGLVEKLPLVDELPIEIDEVIRRLRTQLRRIGPINPEAQTEYQQVSERITFLNEQLHDLQKAETDIKEVINELDLLMEREFRKTFDDVAQEFRKMFTMLFGGGAARLELTQPDDMNETGVEIIARLPGRREQGLSLLSGGERSLTASALIFSLLKVSPPPFCILDEVDAMLDEANVGRFSDILKEMSKEMQFIVVTHNRGTIQTADVLYGVTMGRDSTSQVISLKMEDVSEEFGV